MFLAISTSFSQNKGFKDNRIQVVKCYSSI
jgi:hypothetical protein